MSAGKKRRVSGKVERSPDGNARNARQCIRRPAPGNTLATKAGRAQKRPLAVQVRWKLKVIEDACAGSQDGLTVARRRPRQAEHRRKVCPLFLGGSEASIAEYWREQGGLPQVVIEISIDTPGQAVVRDQIFAQSPGVLKKEADCVPCS